MLALRADFNYLSYGARPGAVGYYITSERNESYRLFLGPQLTVTSGRFKFYAAGTGGIYNIRSVEAVTDYYGYYGYTDTKFSKTEIGWSVGGGILIDIGLGPWIDLEVKYHTISDFVESEVNGIKVTNNGNDLGVAIGVLFFLNN
jgi:hypothetical protein